MNNTVKILDVAKYIVCKFNNEMGNLSITQLKLQKLLYFIEAYYMAKYDKDKLYEENFLAWTYGPVCKKVYDRYKIFMDSQIVEDCNISSVDFGDEINKSIEYVFEHFGRLSATNLIMLTHLKSSPWDETNKDGKSVIKKEKTKEWFKMVFLKNE